MSDVVSTAEILDSGLLASCAVLNLLSAWTLKCSGLATRVLGSS